MKIAFAQVDAFADRPFTGNPAGVMRLDTWLDDALLQAIAAENNLPETAFVVPTTGDAEYELRWFTPNAEVALCGHATLASGHVVLGNDMPVGKGHVRFRTRQAGVLTVARKGDAYDLSLPAWAPSLKPLPAIVAALGVDAVETLWTERGYALIVVANEAMVHGCAPDLRALAALPVVAIVTAPGTATDVVSRVFTPYYAIDEDPVTGSAHAVMTPYWTARLGRDHFTAHQASARGGTLTCRRDGDDAVLTGRCVTVIEGTFSL